MNTVALISLAGQAKIGDRKVLAPKVENSWFGQKRKPLETYFNMTYFNTLLSSNNYATLVDEENYNSNCSLADASHVTIHFVYEGGRNEKQDIVGKLAGKLMDGPSAECPRDTPSKNIRMQNIFVLMLIKSLNGIN